MSPEYPPNVHMVRYIYPSLLYPRENLILDPPVNCSERPRPQGETAYDTTFCTFARARTKIPLSKDAEPFQALLTEETEKDLNHWNPLDRAMARISKTQGATILECGKFMLRGRKVIVIKRRTELQVGDEADDWVTDGDSYEITEEHWKTMEEMGPHPYFHWWTRFDDLITQRYDRAYFNVQKRLLELGIPEPVWQWLPRQDIARLRHVKILSDPRTANLPDDEKSCSICMEEYYKGTDVPVHLPCKHYICLTDFTSLHDQPDGVLLSGERAPTAPFWRCPLCRHIMPVRTSRLDVIHPDERQFWRWKTIYDFMKLRMTGRDFNTYLHQSADAGYIPQFETSLYDGEEVAKTYIRTDDAMDFVEVVCSVAGLLPYRDKTHPDDNPVTFAESRYLYAELQKDLQELERFQRSWKLFPLWRHLLMVAKDIEKDMVIDRENRLGNPVFPPGYEIFRNFLCEWMARGCFLDPMIVSEHKHFVNNMCSRRGVWWKNHPFLRR